jgi:hypothetical protein
MILNPDKLRKKVSLYRLAQELKTAPSTLYSWKIRVPRWRVAAIEAYCEAHDIDISDCYEEE